MKRPIKLTDADIERFWSKVNVKGPNDCWEWIGARTAGYGMLMTAGNTTLRANRIATFLEYGPSDLDACHTCDNPPCCNPRHLFWGTKCQNLQDASRKGRCSLQRYPHLAQGEKNNSAKLTVAAVAEIKRSDESSRLAALRFGVCRSSIKNIRSGKTWGHVA